MPFRVFKTNAVMSRYTPVTAGSPTGHERIDQIVRALALEVELPSAPETGTSEMPPSPSGSCFSMTGSAGAGLPTALAPLADFHLLRLDLEEFLIAAAHHAQFLQRCAFPSCQTVFKLVLDRIEQRLFAQAGAFPSHRKHGITRPERRCCMRSCRSDCWILRAQSERSR